MIQLDFFEDREIGELKQRMKSCEDSCSKVRKKLFAENGEIKKVVIDLLSRVEIIEKGLCEFEMK